MLLSSRYITDRSLPDKAIDLMDEAASRIKIEIESKPADIDRLERKIAGLRVELVSVAKDKDKGAMDRAYQINEQIAELTKEFDVLNDRWLKERGAIDRISEIREKLDELGFEGERAQMRGDFERASKIIYSELPGLRTELDARIAELAELQKDGALLSEVVTEDDIAKVVSRWTGVPVTKLKETEQQKLIKMEENLHDRVIGQHEAVIAVSDAVRRARSGLQDPNRPIGSFLFAGPTGVGKTELARALAEFLFDDENATVRIDMSEYMEKHSVARLIGAPPGYVGYDEGGQLTEAVRRRPYCVVLLDEIEKAHPDVFNILLQVLDDGRLTDSKGRNVDFKNTVIIMTSNAGAQKILEAKGDRDKAKEGVLDALNKAFRPEFLNRIDDKIVFDGLTLKDIRRILDIQLKRVRKLLAARELTLEMTDPAKDALAEAGFDPIYGARPLKRAIQQYLVNPMSKAIVGGEFEAGDTMLITLEGDNQIAFERVPAPPEFKEARRTGPPRPGLGG